MKFGHARNKLLRKHHALSVKPNRENAAHHNNKGRRKDCQYMSGPSQD